MANKKWLIDAERFKRILQGFEGHLLEAGKTEAAEAVKTIIKGLKTEPTVDAVEVVHGRWISSGCGFDCCSECRKVYADGYLTAMGIKPRTQFNYCPNCGAKMDGDGNV